MSARRLAIVTEICSPAGRSATRVRIWSGRVSWRRRLCARFGEMPRSAQTAAIRSCFAQAGAGLPAVAQLLLLVDERELSRWLAWAWMRRISSGVGLRGRAAARSGCWTGARPSIALAAGELVAGLGGEQAALAVVDAARSGWRGSGRWPMHGTSWPVAHQHRGEPLDSLLGDLAARVGGELECSSATRSICPSSVRCRDGA